jgi:endonuclease-3 related protein
MTQKTLDNSIEIRENQPLPTDVSSSYSHDLFKTLLSTYGPQNWWPGDSVFEIMVGAILTQNTQWNNVEKAIKRLKEMKILEPRKLSFVPLEELKTAIKDAGCYNQKALRLKSLVSFLLGKQLNFYQMMKTETTALRNELLQINGIGKETADSILLYALGHKVFVVDAYTKRLFSRLRYRWMTTGTYDEIQDFFISQLPSEVYLYNEFHALIVFHSKYYCRTRPNCTNCVIKAMCHYNNATIDK